MKRKTSRTVRAKSPAARAREVLARLERRGSRENVEGLARFGIRARKAFGVSVDDLRALGKQLGRDHALALALWKSGWHEARVLAAFVDEPERVTPDQMDRWASEFENWADCDAVCFHLFDRTPHAWAKIATWSRSREEFVKRAAFALLASVALHDRECPDAPFVRSLAQCRRASSDERNFVKKGVSWALRAIGQRNAKLHRAALDLADELVGAADSTARWIGRDVKRDLERELVRARIAKRASR